MNHSIHWLRILLFGFLAELGVFIVVLPIALLFGQKSLLYTAPLASLVMCFLLALWLGRKIESRLVLHGFLVGVVATLIYLGLDRLRAEPLAYLVAHGLKMLGGAAGGMVASRRKVEAKAAAAPMP